MADKNIQMTQRNSTNDGWDNINPKTTGANVTAADGETTFESHLTDNVNSFALKANSAYPAFTGVAEVQGNTSYLIPQLHNIILSTGPAVLGTMNIGDLWIMYV